MSCDLKCFCQICEAYKGDVGSQKQTMFLLHTLPPRIQSCNDTSFRAATAVGVRSSVPGSLEPCAMSSSVEAEQGMYREVHRRLVQTGEWDRILALLAQKLNESGWIDDLRHKGTETARRLEPLKFRALLEQVEPHAHASIPLAIKQEVMVLITQFLERQFEA